LILRYRPSFMCTAQAISLGTGDLILPLHTQYIEGVGCCNEGYPNAAIRWLGRTAMKAKFPTRTI
jgi:hypothetical protein